MTEYINKLLKDIDSVQSYSFTNDTPSELRAAKKKLVAYDLIEERTSNNWVLTKDGYKAIELGFDQWLKHSGNNEMTLYDKIPLKLERGHFIDIVPLFPNESYEDLRKICLLLKKDGIIEIKGGRIYAFGIGDKIYAGDLTPQIECRLLRDNKTQHTTVIDKSINLKDSMYVGGDNSGNMGQSSNFSNTHNNNNTQPTTNNPAIKKSLLSRTWTLISDNKLISTIIVLLLTVLAKFIFG